MRGRTSASYCRGVAKLMAKWRRTVVRVILRSSQRSVRCERMVEGSSDQPVEDDDDLCGGLGGVGRRTTGSILEKEEEEHVREGRLAESRMARAALAEGMRQGREEGETLGLARGLNDFARLELDMGVALGAVEVVMRGISDDSYNVGDLVTLRDEVRRRAVDVGRLALTPALASSPAVRALRLAVDALGTSLESRGVVVRPISTSSLPRSITTEAVASPFHP